MHLLLIVALVWVAWATLLFAFQRRIVFVGQSIPAGPRPALPPGGELFHLPVGEDATVEGWYLPGEGRSAQVPGPALVFSHGNGELVDDWLGAFRACARRGVGVLLVEFPGYGRSGGRPGETTVVRSVVAAFDTLAARPEVDAGRIVAVGRSLGGGAAAALTRHRPVAALVLESSFTGARAFAHRFLLPGFLVRDPFDNLGAVAAFDGPVLIVHGRRDEIIPWAHGEALARAAGVEPVGMDCGHNDCYRDWEGHVDRLLAFLRQHGILEPPSASTVPAGDAARRPDSSREGSAAPSPAAAIPPAHTRSSTTMATEYVTRWLTERKPKATVTYEGLDEDGIHIWDLDFPDTRHEFRLGIPDEVASDDGLLSERLMELETQGWLDQAGEKDIWVLVAAGEVAERPGLFE